MKAIITLIVTLTLGMFSLQASTTNTSNNFTVTQLAFDAQNEIEIAVPKMQERMTEDKNESNTDSVEENNNRT